MLTVGLSDGGSLVEWDAWLVWWRLETDEVAGLEIISLDRNNPGLSALRRRGKLDVDSWSSRYDVCFSLQLIVAGIYAPGCD